MLSVANFWFISMAAQGSFMLFLNILKISKISFWAIWKRNWLSLATWAPFHGYLNSNIQYFHSLCYILIWISHSNPITSIWKAEKLAKIKLVRVLEKTFWKFQLSLFHLHFQILFCWAMINPNLGGLFKGSFGRGEG